MTELLWPRYASPADLKHIESIPLAQRGLPESTYELLARAARLWPDRTALNVLPDASRWTEPSHRTFSELLSDVHKTANALHDLGIQRHSAVALLSPNCDELITATLAAQLAGIAAPINGALSADHITELVIRAGARVLIAAAPELDPASWATAQQLISTGVVDAVLALRPTGAMLKPNADVAYLGQLAEKYDGSTFHGQPPTAGDLAALFHTGGTTGKPKPAAHTHANEVTDAWMIAANSLLDDDSVLFAGLPLFHVNALVVTLLAPLLRGQQAVWAGPLGYRDTALYATFWKIVQQYGIGAMSAVPTVYAVLAQCPVDADITSLRYALVGASALPAAVRTDFESHIGVPLVEGYGLTEASPGVTTTLGESEPKPGSVGRPLPNVELRIADEQGEDVEGDDPGEILIRGGNLFSGYWPDGVDGPDAEGWYRTGDVGFLDGDGDLFLVDRLRELIIVSGFNVFPSEVEDVLVAAPGVREAAVIGVPSEETGEAVKAFVVPLPDASVDVAAVREYAGSRLARFKCPVEIEVVENLPHSVTGKVAKGRLRGADR